MGRADFLQLGDWNTVCWQCGFKAKASTLVRNWQGYYVHPEHNEPRQTQDFVRGVPDNQTAPWVQPLPAAIYTYTNIQLGQGDGVNKSFQLGCGLYNVTVTSAKVSNNYTFTANALLFGTWDGITNTAQLTSPFGDNTTSVNVTATHRTDWQGRQLLYPTARTNMLKQSDNLNVAPWGGNPTKTLTATLYAGVIPYFEIKKTTTSNSESLSQNTGYSAAIGDVAQLRIAMRAGTKTNGSVGINGTGDNWGPNANSSAVIVSGPGTITQASGGYFTITGLTTTADTVVLITRTFVVAQTTVSVYLYPGTPISVTIGDSNLFTAAMFTLNGGTMGAHISTTTAAVTVTDYTYTNAGVVSLGQVPDATASLDWDGTGTVDSITSPAYTTNGTGLITFTTPPIAYAIVTASGKETMA